MKINRIRYFFLLAFFPLNIMSQNFNATLNKKFSQPLELELSRTDSIVHTSFKPILQRDISKIGGQNHLASNLSIQKNEGRSLLARKLFFEHLIQLETEDIYLTIDPIFYFEYGKESQSDKNSFYKNTRGIRANLSIGNKVSIHTSFRENQATLPSYIDLRTRSTGVAYGQGRYKTFKEDGFDFAMSSAYVSYSPSKYINLQFGHGKHFIGQGHRSLLLSDLSFNYPFLRINTSFLKDKFNYQNLFTSFQSLERLDSEAQGEELFERQRGVFHFLEFKPSSKFSIGLFESMIYVAKDSSGNVSAPIEYYVPIIFLNSALNDDHISSGLFGINMELRLIDKWLLYSQLAINESFERELAFQIGSKAYISKSWMLQLEYNSQSDLANMNYSHYNESLSSPVIFNTNEFLTRVQYQNGRWIPSASLHMQPNSELEIMFADAMISYLINPAYNFTIDLGMQIRNSNIEPSATNSTYYFFGIRTNLQNLYFDY